MDARCSTIVSDAADAARSFSADVRHIIFDLGGVLYDIEYECVEREFAKIRALGGVPAERRKTYERSEHSSATTATPEIRYTRSTQPAVFTQYEIGAISTAEFREGLRRELGLQGSDAVLDAAWNSMLLGVYDGREQLLMSLKPHYDMVLLSNTNELHIEHVREQCRGIFAVLERLFFSYEMGARKPEPEIFQRVLDTMGWQARETLFIDDSPQHLQGAQSVGIHTLWLQDPRELESIAALLIDSAGCRG
jgi:putative hydrolase of the HAD superfamily